MLNIILKNKKTKKKGILMSHIYYGDPNEYFSLKLVKKIIESRIDILEFGVPFSDPTADGPKFINACQRSINAGMNVNKCINGIKKIRKIDKSVPIIVTSYFNIVLQYGIQKFIEDIKKAGANGLIVPEVVLEESEELLKYSKIYGICLIYLIGPYTSEERIKKIVKKSSGFIYLVAVNGVTGQRKKVENSTFELIKKVRKYTNLPLLVGFGISKKEHVKLLIKKGASGVIIGSAIGKIYESHITNGKIINENKCLNEVSKFIASINKGLT